MPLNLVSRPYRIRRMEIVLATAKLYIRTFWWMIVGIPISGIMLLALFREPILEYVGTVMILWPITIPARAAMVSAKQFRKMQGPVQAIITDDAIFIRPEDGKGIRVGFDWLRQIRPMGPLWLLQGHRLQFAAIKSDAFEPADWAEAEALFKANDLL